MAVLALHKYIRKLSPETKTNGTAGTGISTILDTDYPLQYTSPSSLPFLPEKGP